MLIAMNARVVPSFLFFLKLVCHFCCCRTPSVGQEHFQHRLLKLASLEGEVLHNVRNSSSCTLFVAINLKEISFYTFVTMTG